MKFILTKELGRLTRWLRLFGYDAVYFDSDDLKKLFMIAFNESRLIVTKRKALSGAKSEKVICVKSDSFKKQIVELKKNINLATHELFTRCADCNTKVHKVKKSSVRPVVPEYVFKTQKNFFQCSSCAKIFWKATHWDRAKEFLREVCS